MQFLSKSCRNDNKNPQSLENTGSADFDFFLFIIRALEEHQYIVRLIFFSGYILLYNS